MKLPSLWFSFGAMKKAARLLTLVPALFLILALYLIHRQMLGVDLATLKHQILSWRAERLWLALGLVCLSFSLLVTYDFIGMRETESRPRFWTVLRTAFAGFSISNVVGHQLVSGTSVRIQPYKREGMSLSSISRISLLNLVGYWLGFLFLTGLSLVFTPVNADSFAYAAYLGRTAGLILVGLVIAYLLACAGLAHLRIRLFKKLSFSFPRFKFSISYLVIAATEIAVSTSVLFVLLPETVHISFGDFLSIYLIAHFIGTLSQVPAGLGVLEGVLLKLLEPYGAPHEFFVSIVLFRLFYYFLPLLITLLYALARGIHLGQAKLRARPPLQIAAPSSLSTELEKPPVKTTL